MVQFEVGDVVTLCASIKDFCGTTPVYIIGDINISKNVCSINSFSFGCLNPSGIRLEFQWTNTRSSTPTHGCDPGASIKSLGSVMTDSQGIASMSYTISQNDLDLFNANTIFDLRVCIRDTPDVNALSIGKARDEFSNHGGDYIIIVPATTLVPTHYIDIIIQPWSWYDPNGAAQLIINKLIDIDGAIVNFFADYGIVDYQYINTNVITGENRVTIRINLRSTSLGNGQQYLAIPLIAKIVIIIAIIGLIIIAIGMIKDFIFRTVGNPLNLGPALTNDVLTSAGDEFMKSSMDGCETKTCSDPSLTQDQKAACIKSCVDNALTNWKNYQEKIYPDGDHTPLDTGIAEIQTCYDTYNASGKTPTDYTSLIDCMKVKRDSAVDIDKGNTLSVYKPDASAGEKEKSSSMGILILGALGIVAIGMMSSRKGEGGGTLLIKSEK